MRRQDLLRFLLVSALFLVGLYILNRNLTPPQQERDKPKDKDAAAPKQEAKPSALTALAGAAGHLVERQRREDDRNRKSWADQPKAWHQLGAVAGPAWAASGKPLPRPKVAPVPRITLGEFDKTSKYHLGVVLDPRGACVRKIVLNKFETADKYGRPVDSRLELVPEQADIPEQYQLGSFVLYRYDANNPDSDRPLDDLGNIVWKVE